MSEKREYWAVGDGFVNGTWRSAGEVVLMLPAQARYHVQDGRLSEAPPVIMPMGKKSGAASGNRQGDGKITD